MEAAWSQGEVEAASGEELALVFGEEDEEEGPAQIPEEEEEEPGAEEEVSAGKPG